MNAQSRVFVAGASTLIGRALIRRLEGQGITRVVGVDDALDFADGAAVDRFFSEVRPDAVVVAAGTAAGIAANQKCPADLMRDNLLVASHVIPSAWRHGTKQLLYLSSSCTYPRLAPQPLRIESLWTGPVEPTSGAYAVAKLAGMQLCQAYAQQHGARFVTAIKGDAFGPGDDFSEANSHVVGGLMRRMHEAKTARAASVVIWGSGSPRREFIYADDLADACIFLMRHYDGRDPINVGTGLTTSIRELADMLREIVGYEGELRFDASRPDGMPLKGLDSSPLTALGWRPAWDLRAALRQTYEWFVAHLASLEEQAAG